MELAQELNDKQREAVLHTEGPLLIVAGAGAGKTKTITHRIAHLIETGEKPHQILAVTFTNKAAGEMRSRVARLRGVEPTQNPYATHLPRMTTFHSLGVQLLREYSDAAGLPHSFAIWDRDDSVRALKRALKETGVGENVTPRQVLSRISREKGRGVSAETFMQDAGSFYIEMVGEIWLAYEALQAKEGALDFDDLLLRARNLLRDTPAVLKELHARWHHLTIDEYQDTNLVQYETAKLLSSGTNNICAVADPDQTIYTWRGADPRYTLMFERDFPGAKVILLEENYRSTQTILTAANGVISKNRNRFDKRLFTTNPTGEAIGIFAGEADSDEALFVAQSARELLASGVAPAEIAVLFRENFQSRALEEGFIRLGLPYRVLGVRFFDRAEVKDVLAYIKSALNAADMISFMRAAGVPSRGIGKVTLEAVAGGKEATLSPAARTKIERFRTVLGTVREAIQKLPSSEAVRVTLIESGLEKKLGEGSEEERERLNNIFELVAHATRYDSLAAPLGIEKLLEDAALMGEQDSLVTPTRPAEGAISLMTVHAAKGLEFDAVFVTGLEQGLFPSERASEDAERDDEEERRLFYVALTRAKKVLYLTLAGMRLRYGARELTRPSTFLEDIDPRLLTFADTPQISAEPIID